MDPLAAPVTDPAFLLPSPDGSLDNDPGPEGDGKFQEGEPLVDRGHRELPIRVDFVGKNIPTQPDESVKLLGAEPPGLLEVVLERRAAGEAPLEGEGA